jgi:predicted small secreted protein
MAFSPQPALSSTMDPASHLPPPPLDARRVYYPPSTEEADMTRISKIILTIAGAAALAACNTEAGIGRDVESVGDKIEDVAS